MPTPHNPSRNHDRPAIAVLDTAGRHNDLPLLTAAVRPQDGQQEQQIVRQWRILKLLTYSPEGFTVKELAVLPGMNEKTVRRLPYTDPLATLMLLGDGRPPVGQDEILRVLSLHGEAWHGAVVGGRIFPPAFGYARMGYGEPTPVSKPVPVPRTAGDTDV